VGVRTGREGRVSGEEEGRRGEEKRGKEEGGG